MLHTRGAMLMLPISRIMAKSKVDDVSKQLVVKKGNMFV